MSVASGRPKSRASGAMRIPSFDDLLETSQEKGVEPRLPHHLMTITEMTEANLWRLLEALPEATIMTTRDGRITVVNRQTETLFCYPRDELVGQSIEILVPERYRAARAWYESRDADSPKARPTSRKLQLTGRRRDGSEFPVEVSLGVFEASDGFQVVSSMRDVSDRDVSERRAAEQALHAAKEAAVRAERDRIARDLHDTVSQAIFSASLIADSLPRIWERSPADGQRGLDELRQLTHGALAEMRTMLFDLRPAALLEKKLGDLIRQLGTALSSRTQTAVSVVAHEEGSLPPDVHVALYRIVQEALNNVAKHAGADHVWVKVESHPHRVLLRIRDDGCGFDTATLPGGQLGMGIMQERARSIGARLRVRSHPDHGTRVVVTWCGTGRRLSDD